MFPTSELFLVTNGASIAFAFAIVILMAFPASPSHIEYSTVTGYFVQDEPATNPLQLSFVGVSLPLPLLSDNLRPEERPLGGEGDGLLISPKRRSVRPVGPEIVRYRFWSDQSTIRH
jgi:hypothetical protein